LALGENKKQSLEIRVTYITVYCLTALLRISTLDRMQNVCQASWFKGIAVLWLFISLLVSNLYEAKMTEALIVEPDFDHPKDFASLLHLNYTKLLIEKHIKFYNESSEYVRRGFYDSFTLHLSNLIQHSFFFGYVTIN